MHQSSRYNYPSQLSTSRKAVKKQPSRPLELVLVQNNIKENNLEYQQLLIKSKQLQITMGQLQAQLNRLLKQKKKADKLADDATRRKELAMTQLKEKQIYLQKYYDELDRKFRGGRDDLFAGLKKLEHSLIEMYRRDEKRIKESLQPEREEYARVEEIVSRQRNQRDRLRQQLYNLQRLKEANVIGHFGSEKEEIMSENQYLKDQIERLSKERKTLENQEKILKRILNVEQQHKKHGSVIAAGIRKIFTIKVKEQRYKEAVAQDYAKNIAGLREIITKRKAEKQSLIADLEDRKVKLQTLKQENALKNKQYGLLQDELFRSEQR